jgi:ABC-type bacteriocin/lantibiotic exporter with double-glycine peptidase domain
VKKIFGVFYPERWIGFVRLTAIVFLNSIVEFFSFALLIPVIYLINDPGFVHRNRLLNAVFTHAGFHSDHQFIFFLLALMLILFVFKNQLALYTVYRLNAFSYSVSLDIVRKQVNGFFNAGYAEMKGNSATDYLRSIMQAPLAFSEFLLMPLIYILNELLVIFFIAAGLLLYKPYIILLVLVTILPVSLLLLKIFRKRLHHISNQKGMFESESYKEILEAVNGYTDIVLSGGEAAFAQTIEKKLRSLFLVNSRRAVFLLIPRRIIEVLVIFVILVIYGLASFVFDFGSKELVLMLITFATASYRLLPSLNEIFTHIVNIRTWQFTFDLLKLISDPQPEAAPRVPPLAFSGAIQLQDVFYKYHANHKVVLDGLNLIVHKGDIILITGESGSGKSTLAKILAGFIKPLSGNVLFDGEALTHLSQIKKKLAYVTQDFYLFDKTIIENIAPQEELKNINTDKAAEVLAAVNLSAFIEGLEQGMYQRIGELGSKISGGERQRLALARALYKNAELLILDEATNSLDKANEASVLQTIFSIARQKNLTVLLIGHKLEACKGADAVYALIDGKLKSTSVNNPPPGF